MRHRRPPRLVDFPYIGKIGYFVTICTHERTRAFENRDFSRLSVMKLLSTALRFKFSITAYCMMPDHVHLVLLGQHDDSDFNAFMRSLNTQTGFAWRQRFGGRLWQGGYYERVLRNDAEVYHAACYVVMNPVRAGLVDDPKKYEFTGSSTYPIEHFIDRRT